jgi:exodeoxyribonuclease-5
MTELDPGQRAAVEKACRFVASGRRGHLWIGGLAGTGKTTVLQELANRLPDVPLLAPTNKAANVIGQKLGNRITKTIHNAIKLYRGQEVRAEDGKLGPVFKEKRFEARTVLLDECSMVEEKLGADLQAVCNQIIAFGDPGQLGPVGKNVLPFFKGKPDAVLTTNHRQKKAGAGILRAAYDVRDGKQVFTVDSNEFTAYPLTGKFTEADFNGVDTVLVHQNKTRHQLNDCYRAYRGIAGKVRAGERLVAQRHIRDEDIIKSDRFLVLKDHSPGAALVLRSLDTDKVFKFQGAVIDQLGQPEPEADIPFFAFGYAITVHMAQGSEVPSVLIVDDYWVPPNEKYDFTRWCYVAITRGAKRVTILSNRFPIAEDWRAA